MMELSAFFNVNIIIFNLYTWRERGKLSEFNNFPERKSIHRFFDKGLKSTIVIEHTSL